MNDSLATNEQDAAATAAWARARGLSYERTGSLPPVAPILQADPGTARIGDGPGKWTENLCAGDLPGGVRGTIGHHTYLTYSNDTWHEVHSTVTVATVLEGTRIARGIRGESSVAPSVKLYQREHGPTERQVEMPDGRFTWTVPAETDDAMLSSVFDARVVEAIRRLPDWQYDVCQREGSLSVALLNQHATDPALLDSLCELTAGLAAGAARVPWQRPPDDLESAVAVYRSLADADPGVGTRRFRARALVIGAFALVGVIAAAPAAVAGGLVLGLAAFLVLLVLGLVVAALVGRSVGRSESGFRSEAWGLEAFAAEYARWRGYRLEDPQEFCKRFTVPLFGSPQRCMRGELAPGVDGRILFWRDRNEPGPAAYVNVAVAPGTLTGSPSRPFGAVQAGEWVVVYDKTTRDGRSIARLDAIAAEAARLTTRAPAPR